MFFFYYLFLFVLFESFHSIFIFTKCPQDLKEFTDQELRSMWFGEYPKTDKVGQSSGFEHTFVGKDILSLSP